MLRLLTILLTWPILISAVDLKPWFGRDKMLEVRPWEAYQYIPTFDTAHGTVHHATNNAFIGTDVSICTDNQYAVEGDLSLFRTRLTSFTLEQASITARYKVLNDIVDDLFSLVVGATFTFPTKRAVRDYNVIYHSKVEVELHAAVGKELSCGAYYDSRWWAAVVVGMGNEGSPWLQGRAVWEKNFLNQHQWRIFADAAAGLGSHNLHLTAPFKGYRNIAYRIVDVGAGYTLLINDCGATISLDGSYRVWGRNSPTQAQTVLLALMLPFHL